MGQENGHRGVSSSSLSVLEKEIRDMPKPKVQGHLENLESSLKETPKKRGWQIKVV